MSSFLTQLNIRAAKDAKIPEGRNEREKGNNYHKHNWTPNPNWENTMYTHKNEIIERERGRTGEVVDEGNLDRAADNGINPDPPAGAENGAGDARPKDCP